jgi:polar amino acid transport system ATP-binding protein
MISIRNLSKRYQNLIIFQNVNLEIDRGDAVAIIGPSGCGKSTLLRCINGLERPTEGEVWFDGMNLTNSKASLEKIRSRMGMVYQSFNLFSHLNVLENVMMAPMVVNHIPKQKAAQEALEYLKLVGLQNRSFHMPNQLSGGQKQRIAIARCLAMQPDVILFDEPTSALDPTMVDEVLGVIQRLIREKMTCVIVTHEMEFARKVSNKVVYMDEMGIYETGTPDQIFLSPCREKTQAFIHKLHVFEKNINEYNADIYSFMSEVRSYCSHLIYEELIFPLIKNRGSQKEINFKLRSTSAGEKMEIFIADENASEDILLSSNIDEFGVKIIRASARKVSSTFIENKAVVHIEL